MSQVNEDLKHEQTVEKEEGKKEEGKKEEGKKEEGEKEGGKEKAERIKEEDELVSGDTANTANRDGSIAQYQRVLERLEEAATPACQDVEIVQQVEELKSDDVSTSEGTGAPQSASMVELTAATQPLTAPAVKQSGSIKRKWEKFNFGPGTEEENLLDAVHTPRAWNKATTPATGASIVSSEASASKADSAEDRARRLQDDERKRAERARRFQVTHTKPPSPAQKRQKKQHQKQQLPKQDPPSQRLQASRSEGNFQIRNASLRQVPPPAPAPASAPVVRNHGEGIRRQRRAFVEPEDDFEPGLMMPRPRVTALERRQQGGWHLNPAEVTQLRREREQYEVPQQGPVLDTEYPFHGRQDRIPGQQPHACLNPGPTFSVARPLQQGHLHAMPGVPAGPPLPMQPAQDVPPALSLLQMMRERDIRDHEKRIRDHEERMARDKLHREEISRLLQMVERRQDMSLRDLEGRKRHRDESRTPSPSRQGRVHSQTPDTRARSPADQCNVRPRLPPTAPRSAVQPPTGPRGQHSVRLTGQSEGQISRTMKWAAPGVIRVEPGFRRPLDYRQTAGVQAKVQEALSDKQQKIREANKYTQQLKAADARRGDIRAVNTQLQLRSIAADATPINPTAPGFISNASQLAAAQIPAIPTVSSNVAGTILSSNSSRSSRSPSPGDGLESDEETNEGLTLTLRQNKIREAIERLRSEGRNPRASWQVVIDYGMERVVLDIRMRLVTQHTQARQEQLNALQTRGDEATTLEMLDNIQLDLRDFSANFTLYPGSEPEEDDYLRRLDIPELASLLRPL
ncbi:hypothetical protein MMC18_004040 [Xylographa bjoerkii]|nr:hypothetical protein [Xylographa bjoerkii]